jgi:hypothetical protein
MATAADVRDLLRGTSLPSGLVDLLVEGAAATWLMGESAEVLAGDLALCHPSLAEGEVRAVVNEAGGDGRTRLTVVAADRPGLLAGVAAALAAHRLEVCSVRGTAWPAPAMALLNLSVRSDPAGGPVPWDAVGEQLRGALRGGARPLRFQPTPPVQVTVSPQDAGRFLVAVDAPEQLELLWATARWFEESGVNIEAASIDATSGRFRATFLAAGPGIDAADLATALSGRAARSRPGRGGGRGARRLAQTGVVAGGFGAVMAWRGRRAARGR